MSEEKKFECFTNKEEIGRNVELMCKLFFWSIRRKVYIKGIIEISSSYTQFELGDEQCGF